MLTVHCRATRARETLPLVEEAWIDDEHLAPLWVLGVRMDGLGCSVVPWTGVLVVVWLCTGMLPPFDDLDASGHRGTQMA